MTTTAEKFWSGWLKVTMWIVIIAGIFLSITVNLMPWNYLDKQIDQVFFPGQALNESVEMLKHWLIAISGAVMVGWGSCMLYVVNHPFRQKEKWAWRCIFYPVIFWYFLDTSVSIYYGANFNVVINTILFLQVLAPLLFFKNQFFPKTIITV
jgi:hypothetical protein